RTVPRAIADVERIEPQHRRTERAKVERRTTCCPLRTPVAINPFADNKASRIVNHPDVIEIATRATAAILPVLPSIAGVPDLPRKTAEPAPLRVVEKCAEHRYTGRVAPPGLPPIGREATTATRTLTATIRPCPRNQKRRAAH